MSALRAGTWEPRDIILLGREGPGCTQAWGSPAFWGDVGQGANRDGPTTPADWVSTRRVHSVSWAGSLRIRPSRSRLSGHNGQLTGLVHGTQLSGAQIRLQACTSEQFRKGTSVGRPCLQGVPDMPRAWGASPPTH